MPDFCINGNTLGTLAPEAGLYLVATPIGNLADISIRALRVLAGVDLIACEDTRTSAKLLNFYGVKTPMKAYHEHNSVQAGPKILDFLKLEKSVALISDAGTPLISDPGYKLVKSARASNINVFPIPGASALLAGLVASGLETDSFFFGGFLPSKQSARRKVLQSHTQYPHTMIYYESPNRVHQTIDDMVHIFGQERQAALCREITKLHEEYYTGSLGKISSDINSRKLRGEIVIVIGAGKKDEYFDVDAVLIELLEEMSLSKAAGEAANLTGLPKRELYNRALQIKKTSEDGA